MPAAHPSMLIQKQPIGQAPSHGPLEKEADRAAVRATGGEPVGALGPAAPGSGGGLNDREPGPGQMAKAEFMDTLERLVCAVLDEELPGGSAGCPDLAFYMAKYRGRPATQVERTIKLWASPRDGSPEAMAKALVDRVRIAARNFRPSGRIEALPTNALAWASAGMSALQRKPVDGGQKPATPTSVLARLGRGATLPAALRGPMERSFGRSFAEVRIHTGAAAGSLASELGARAFTVVQQIGLGAGACRP